MRVVAYPGKRTSGRYVYRGRGEFEGWFWQCDLHDEDPAPPDQAASRLWPTMQEAFAEALEHAKVCGLSNE